MEARPSVLDTGGSARPRATAVAPFPVTLERHGLELARDKASTLQVNVGLRCNQSCRHCHLDAGPDRVAMMDQETIDEVVAFAQRKQFRAIDITGGAPELHPEIDRLIERLSPLSPRTLFRSNLTALVEGRDFLIETLRAHRVVIVASFPSVNAAQAEAQRGKEVLAKSIESLKKLNALGYGHQGSCLELNLVSNPTGAFLPVSQEQAERKFKRDLERKWGIVFNNLYTFANVPLGRFRAWLVQSGNFETYMERLASRFNPCTVQGLMCRTLVSVSWDGYLFDCDFNLAAGLFMGATKSHVAETDEPPVGIPVAVSDHCYACTAGSGFS